MGMTLGAGEDLHRQRYLVWASNDMEIFSQVMASWHAKIITK